MFKPLVGKVFCLTIFLFLCLYYPKIIFATNVWTQSDLTSGYGHVIKFAPSNPQIGYATHQGVSSFPHVYKTINGGLNWFATDNGITGTSDSNSIVVDYADENHVYVGLYNNGVYETIDGINWVYKGTPGNYIRSLAIDPNNSSILYAGTNNGIYKSLNSGSNWTSINGGIVTGNVMYISVSKSPNSSKIICGTGNAVYLSNNSGATWGKISTFNSKGTNGALLIDPENYNYIYAAAGYNYGLWKSIDGGTNWTNVIPSYDPFEIAISTINNKRYIFTSSRDSYSGIYKFDTELNTYENITGNLPYSKNWGLAINDQRLVTYNENGGGIWYHNNTIEPPPPTPMVFIPGLGGSWNRDALIENKAVGQNEWTLTPFATGEYKAFIQTLKNAGLVEGSTLFTFYYDWRRPVTENGTKLKTFLDGLTGTVNIVGHSMGGLVARACIDKVAGCKDKVAELITAGTPHTGAVDAYYLWNGVIPEKDQLKKTLEEILLKINNRGYSQPKDIVRNVIPSIRDILPVFDYSNWHSYSAMNSANKNPFLETSMANTGLLTTISGNKSASTPEKLNVSIPTSIEYALGLWLDGRPLSKILGTGDETVLKSSSKIGVCLTCDFETYHGGLVGTENPQKKILELLGLPTTNAISTFNPNDTWQSLWFILHSPATIKVFKNGVETGTSFDGKLIYIENPADGQYDIKITGTGNGSYTLDIGAIGQDKTNWQTVNATASTGSEHQYKLNLNNFAPAVGDADGSVNLTLAKNKLAVIGGFWPNYFINVINGIQNNSGGRVKIENLAGKIMTQIKTSAVASVRSDYADVIEYLINAYEIMAPKYGYVLSSTVVLKDLTRTQTLIANKNSYYLIVKPTTLAALNFTLANSYLTKSQTAFGENKFYRSYLFSRAAFQIL
ncbi:MAG: hypothetical protein Q7S14_01010 [bacterium]|nr:hypothetical protein [bacterium]